jgi:hypothetical protein
LSYRSTATTPVVPGKAGERVCAGTQQSNGFRMGGWAARDSASGQAAGIRGDRATSGEGGGDGGGRAWASPAQTAAGGSPMAAGVSRDAIKIATQRGNLLRLPTNGDTSIRGNTGDVSKEA